MVYTDEERQEIEKVFAAFSEYVTTSEYIDLVRSEKFGYILIYFNLPTRGLGLEPVFISDGSELCKLLLTEIATDVLEMTKNEHGVTEADPLEKAEILRRISPYAENLTAYHHIFENLFTDA